MAAPKKQRTPKAQGGKADSSAVDLLTLARNAWADYRLQAPKDQVRRDVAVILHAVDALVTMNLDDRIHKLALAASRSVDRAILPVPLDQRVKGLTRVLLTPPADLKSTTARLAQALEDDFADLPGVKRTDLRTALGDVLAKWVRDHGRDKSHANRIVEAILMVAGVSRDKAHEMTKPLRT